MFGLILLLTGLGGLLATTPGSQNSFLQIVSPEKLQEDTNNNSELNDEQLSYIIPVDKKLYTVHLQKRLFLADNFRVYLYDKGSVNSHTSNIKTHCYYQGYIEGYPNSFVTLNTCFGLRGILQFENVSYGIEPLELAVEFQHLLYKYKNEINEFPIFTESSRSLETQPKDQNNFLTKKTDSTAPNTYPLYLEMHIVVDKTLYDYLGSDDVLVTNRIFEIIGLLNLIFAQIKVTTVLSSLELWSDKNKISTDGEADDILHRFLEWKKFYLTLRPHDVAYLFIYREYPNYIGAVFPGKMCDNHYSTGLALYTNAITLEAFSVVVSQLLGFSLGLSYDDPKECHCSGTICLMNPEAAQSSGVKMFSNCSLNDFENFISNMPARCLQNKPLMQIRRPICGNGKVEGNEVCDCGTNCPPDTCCNPKTCQLKEGATCLKGLCCKDCKIAELGTECRPSVHAECDIPEFCNGTSPMCDPDITIQNGQLCKNKKFMCFNGECHDLDERCEKTFGKGSKNAPFICYEEIQSQVDRFGNCGWELYFGYVYCLWSDLMCGRLICSYPHRIPIIKENAAVIYAFVRNHLCITMAYAHREPPHDTLRIRSGSQCDIGRICVGGSCVESRILESRSKECSKKCHGNGVCNSKEECHCFEGFKPPDCQTRGRGFTRLPGVEGLNVESMFRGNKKKWLLLGICIPLAIVILAATIALTWETLKTRFTKEEDSPSKESKSESSTHTRDSRFISETSKQTEISKSKSEGSIHTSISSSKSQGSTQTLTSSNS